MNGGKLLPFKGGKKPTKPSIFRYLFHLFFHSWTNWSNWAETKVYQNQTDTIPIRVDVRQHRVCKICNKLEIRRIKD